MGSIGIFSSTSNVILTVLSLILLFGACIYASVGTKLGRGVWLLFWGLAVEFVAVAIS